MNDLVEKVRAIALLLPGVEQDDDGAATEFRVEGVPFARVDGDALSVRDGDWVPVAVGDDAASLDDRVARAWELAAPRDLLEAGGR